MAPSCGFTGTDRRCGGGHVHVALRLADLSVVGAQVITTDDGETLRLFTWSKGHLVLAEAMRIPSVSSISCLRGQTCSFASSPPGGSSDEDRIWSNALVDPRPGVAPFEWLSRDDGKSGLPTEHQAEQRVLSPAYRTSGPSLPLEHCSEQIVSSQRASSSMSILRSSFVAQTCWEAPYRDRRQRPAWTRCFVE